MRYEHIISSAFRTCHLTLRIHFLRYRQLYKKRQITTIIGLWKKKLEKFEQLASLIINIKAYLLCKGFGLL